MTDFEDRLCSCGGKQEAFDAAEKVFRKLLENQCPIWAGFIGTYVSVLSQQFIRDHWGIEHAEGFQQLMIQSAEQFRDQVKQVSQKLIAEQETNHVAHTKH